MARSKEYEVTTLPSGVSVTFLPPSAYDWDSIRHLAEKGVAFGIIADHYKGLNTSLIAARAKNESWLTPMRTRKARQALALKQMEHLKRHGAVRPAEEVYNEIWRERQADMDEVTYGIASRALKGVKKQFAKGLIKDAKDLKTIAEVVRKVTGQDQRDAEELDKGPQMAISVNLLRSTGPDSLEFIDID